MHNAYDPSARTDGLVPVGDAQVGLCYAKGASGARVPCTLVGQTWTRVQCPTDPADGMSVTVSGGVPRSLAKRAMDTIRLADYGAVGDGLTDDTVAVQKAAAVGDAVGGARLIGSPGALYLLSATVVSRRANVFMADVKGQVGSNTNGGDIQPGFYWIGPAGGTMLRWAPTNIGDCIWQPGLVDMLLNGATTAAYGAVFDNTKQARVRAAVRNFRVAGVEFNSDSGTPGNFSQNNEVEYLDVVYGVSDATAEMHGVIMRGSLDGSVPATQHRVGKIDGLIKHGYMLKLLHTDNCQVGTLHAATDNGTGGSILIDHTPSAFKSDHTVIGYVAGKAKIHPAIIGTHFLHIISEGSGVDAAGAQYHVTRLTDYVTGAAYSTASRKLIKRLPITLRPLGATGTTRVGGLFEAILMPQGSDAAGGGAVGPDQEASTGTLMSLSLYVTPSASTTGGNLRLRVALGLAADGMSLGVAQVYQIFTIPLPATNAGTRRVLTIPLATPYAEGQDISLVVTRVSGDAADTVAQDIALSPQVALTLTSTGPTSPGSGSYSPPAGQ
jgi:hypothetical protein